MNSINSIGSSSKEQSFDEDLTLEGAGDGDCPPPRGVPFSQHQQQQRPSSIREGELDDDEDNYEDMEESISAPQSKENSFKGILWFFPISNIIISNFKMNFE